MTLADASQRAPGIPNLWLDRALPGAGVPRDPPSSYLRRIHVDTLLFSEAALRATLEVFGPDRLVFGTDWPPNATPTADSLDLIRGLDVPEDVRAGILGGNAADLLGLTVREPA